MKLPKIASGLALISVMCLIGLLTLRAKSATLPLPTYDPVPTFQLTDQSGKPWSTDRLSNKVTVFDFFFSTCAGPCPQMSKHFGMLQDAFGSKIELVSLSVHPEHDTPEVLAQYAKKQRAGENWSFLTGSLEEMQTVICDQFQVGFRENLVQHTTKFILADRQGVVRGLYTGTDEKELEQLMVDIERLL